MEGVSLIVLLAIGVCIFLLGVYFTRWVFGIDTIIDLHKEQVKLLKDISSKLDDKNE